MKEMVEKMMIQEMVVTYLNPVNYYHSIPVFYLVLLPIYNLIVLYIWVTYFS